MSEVVPGLVPAKVKTAKHVGYFPHFLGRNVFHFQPSGKVEQIFFFSELMSFKK